MQKDLVQGCGRSQQSRTDISEGSGPRAPHLGHPAWFMARRLRVRVLVRSSHEGLNQRLALAAQTMRLLPPQAASGWLVGKKIAHMLIKVLL